MVSTQPPLCHEALSLVVVDDAQTSRVFFQRALSHAGYDDIRVADSGRRALDMLAERPADVVIADWMMPGMTGLEMTDEVRARDEEDGRYTAIILATAREGVDALVHSFRHGVDDFLHKPFDARELVARVYAAGNQANAQNMLLEASQRLQYGRVERADSWSTDTDTGLGNEVYFEAQLTTHVMETGMRGGAVCCAVLDVHGQGLEDPANAVALTRIGRRIMRAIRPIDIVCRVGPARFGVVMSAPEDKPFRGPVFDRIEREVCIRPVPAGNVSIPVTITVGRTVWESTSSMLSPSELISRAERDLRDRSVAR